VDYVWDKASIAYIIIIVVLFILNIWLYNIRNLENYDEVVAFAPLRSVFMYTVAVCFGYFGYAIFKQISSVNTLFWGALPLGCVALIAAFMLNRKSFNIKGIALPLIAYIVFVGIVKLAFVTDITGYEKRVPNIDKVVSVEPYENQYNNPYCYGYGSRGEGYYDAAYKGEITDKEGIGDIIALHSYIVDVKPGCDVDNDQYYGSRNFKLKYNLSNGRTMVRQYYISDVKNLSDRENFRKYYERPEYKKAVYPFVNDNKKEISFIEVSGVGVSGIVYISDIDEEKFTEAVKKDIFALTFEDELNISERNANISSLGISYNEIIPIDGVDKKFSCDQTFYLGKRMPNTLAFINEELKKYPNKTYTADDVTSIEISADYYNEDGYISNNFNTETTAETALEGVATETVMDEAEYSNSFDSLERAITDKNDIREIYNLLAISEKSGEIDTNLDSNYGDYWYISFSFISDKNNSGQSCDCTINVSASKVPEVLKKYLK
jgi:hypothetical protein